ncbi:ABC transporter ATP-binding protein [Lancefieldella rimae]|uniref:ABC transporter ATP-binding protein n=1 Tax=Lancefieldella rimae TaxID=1383 RepID=UPI0028E4BF88|nr:ABC transporter ATP-binding protein [Lancefieldella rimae]
MSNEKFSTQEQQMKTAGTQNSTQEASKYPQKRVPAGKVIGRTMKMLWQFYPILLPVALGTAVIQAIMQSVPNIFLERIITIIEQYIGAADWSGAQPVIFSNVALLAGIYVIGLICNVISTQGMAIVTQGALQKFRYKMFDHMQNLPIRYFDSHLNGDVMSYYTNDIDAMRQMIGISLPQLLFTSVILIAVVVIMFYYSIPMALIIIFGSVVMVGLTRFLGGRSARNFMKQQKTTADVEGHIQEIMNGEKVVKVFSHESETEASFDVLNDELMARSRDANAYSNTLMPILNNIGNLLYVIVAIAAGIMISTNFQNVSFSGMALNIAVAVPFLNMTRQFAAQIGQISGQINSVVMGIAGANRIFELLDEDVEKDEGYVTLVNSEMVNGQIQEAEYRTGHWAWKHPHKDGSITYTPLTGDVRLFDVDFAYVPGNTVLHNISLYAKPGQKVAFVGATGAGKTTITNLLNRFYDIEDGKIRYDGININKIKKSSLRRALGVVLQDVNLFTGTVMDNIRYGRLNATDEDCVRAAKLAGADDFIRRLPNGYHTMLKDNGSALSQGQRQLISIARAAVADPPVMILDEATSSIDTRTEAIVQRGMDALMYDRTTFVIAHRLSTVRNSNVIVVLDHGRIIERGTHDELLAKRGTYYQLYTGAFELE